MAEESDTSNALISKEKFEEMRKAIDKDGDGSVDKEEFMAAWTKMFPDNTKEKNEEIWTKMDSDKSGTLEVQELAAFFGFSWESDAANEMSDEQILEALQAQAALAELEAKKEKVEEKPVVPKEPVRDTTITLVNMEKKTASDEKETEIRDMLTCCTLGDLEKTSADQEVWLEKYTEKKVSVRVEDEKGEMPLHKLARLKVDDRNRGSFKKACNAIIALDREQAKAAGKASMVTDTNHQDKAGKTPLFMAIEHKNYEMIDLLYALGTEGPDSILVNSVGWTVMHAAINTDDLKTVKELYKHLTPARTKLLLQTPDKTGREPLHIAAYKCTEEMVAYLIDIGASNKKTDSAGNTASKLAERAGRRKSRELIEEKVGEGK